MNRLWIVSFENRKNLTILSFDMIKTSSEIKREAEKADKQINEEK